MSPSFRGVPPGGFRNRHVLPLLALLATLGMPDRGACTSIDLVDRVYRPACGNVSTAVKEHELAYIMLKWYANGEDFYRVRVLLEPDPNDSFTVNNVTMGNDANPPTDVSVVGDIPYDNYRWSRHEFTWTGTPCGGLSGNYKFKATVYYIDGDGSDDDPFVYTSAGSAYLSFSACNASSTSAPSFPAEVSCLYLVTSGAGVTFKWNYTTGAATYNLYRGDLPIGYDDTTGDPQIAYSHIARPDDSIGFCSQEGTNQSGTLFCDLSLSHLIYTDASEDPDDYYYLIDGEGTCGTPSYPPVEGTLGYNGSGDELPYGGGKCLPMP